MLIPQTRTIVTFEALAPPFVEAFEQLTGEPPEVVDLTIVYGKMVTECGNPGASQCCWNGNVGNIRGESARGNYTILGGAHEYVRPDAVPAGWVVIPNPPGHAQPPGTVAVLPINKSVQKFRAYFAPGDDLAAALREACAEYVEVLGKSFKRTLRALVAHGTTPADVVQCMKSDGYFTGDLSGYVASVSSIARANVSRAEAFLKRDAEPITIELLGRLDDACAATPLRADEGQYTPAYLRDSAKPEEF